MKHGWVMYVFLLILAGVLARNASGTVGFLLGGSQAGSNVINALEGPNTSQTGTFQFGSGSSATKFTLG